MVITMRTANPVRAARIEKLIDMFSQLSIGDTVTRMAMYAKVKDITAVDITEARSKAELRNAAHYAVVRGIGYVRVPAVKGSLDVAESTFTGIRKKLQKKRKLIRTVVAQANDIDENAARAIAQNDYAMGMMMHVAARREREATVVPDVVKPSTTAAADAMTDSVNRLMAARKK